MSVRRDKPTTMKLFVSSLAILLLFLSSCKKGGSSTISGTWEIRTAQNGMIPTITYPPGNDSLLKFTNTTYQVYSKGQVVKSGTFTIVEDKSFDALVVPKDEFTHRIIYDGKGDSTKIFLQQSGKKLTFVSGNFALDYGSKVEFEQISAAGE